MEEALERKVREVRVRLGVGLLLERLAVLLIAAGVLAALAMATDRALSLGVVRAWMWAGLPAAAVLLAVGIAAARRPTRMASAILIDERLGLRERFSTALAFAGSEDAFARAACGEARRAADGAAVRRRFPVRPTRRWGWAAGCWAVAAAVVLLMPELDLLGRAAASRRRQQRQRELVEARAAVKEGMARVEAMVRQLGDPDLAGEMAQLGQMQEAPAAGELKRQAIRRLGELAERVKAAREGEKMRSAERLRSMLRRLRGSGDPMTDRLNQALGRGDFKQAADELRRLKQQLAEGKMSEADARRLAEQLADLGKRLEELAAGRKDLEEALERAGLDKDLAKLSEKDLEEALKEAGLSEEQIKEMMQTCRSCRQACSACGRLGEMLAGAGQEGMAGELSTEELERIGDLLDGLDGLQRRLAVSDMTLEEIEAIIAELGEGEYAEDAEADGLCLGRGKGAGGNTNRRTGAAPGGGRARASGRRPVGPDAKVGMKASGVKNKPSKGPVIASKYFKGPQIKGESRRELKEVTRAAKDRASEAITDNRIPPEYEKPVKKYFGELEGGAE